MKKPLDFFLASILAVCAGLLAYGFIRYPDAPIRPCGANQFCGKHDRPHSEEQYNGFLAWEEAFVISLPFGFAAGFLLERRNRRRAFQAWERLRVLQSELLPTVEEQRYADAWRGLRRREIVARVLSLPVLLLFGWSLLRVSLPEGGLFAPLPLVFFALAVSSNLWFLFFRCPRCRNRFFITSRTISTFTQCVHCGLRRGTTFKESLRSLTDL